MNYLLLYLMERNEEHEEILEPILIIPIRIKISKESREYFSRNPEELSRRIYNIFSHDDSFYCFGSN